MTDVLDARIKRCVITFVIICLLSGLAGMWLTVA